MTTTDNALIPKSERQLVARARHAFTRLVGLELGDELADELWDARAQSIKDSQDGGSSNDEIRGR